MPFIKRYIDFKNFELKDIRIELKRLQSEPEDELIEMEGAEDVCILETVEQDDDKTKSVRGRRLNVGFNSDVTNLFFPRTSEYFAEDEVDWQGRVIMDGGAIPFIGNLVKDDISEAFQPRPNPVRLPCGDGFGVLKGIELAESDGDVIRGEFRLIDYVWLCLRHINYDELPVFIAFNLYEVDTDPVTSNAFWDQFLDALTFETDVNKRDDCYTVLEKILDALGCFITFDNSAYYIIRWDEWDDSTGSVTTLRFAEFSLTDSGPAFVDYSTVNVDKTIVHDQDVDYEGFYLSFDSAQKRFQIKYDAIRHIYKFEQPKELPCNSAFLRGTIISDTPTLKTYEIECWAMFREIPNVSNDGDSYIRVVLNGGVETERYVVLAVQPSNVLYYIESQPIPVRQFDKFTISVDMRHDGQVETASGSGTYNVMQVRLTADNGDHWIFHPPSVGDPLVYWELSAVDWSTNNHFFNRTFDGTDDDTIWNQFGINFEDMTDGIPDNGDLTILLVQVKKPDQFETQFSNLKFTLYPIIDGTYDVLTGQQTQVGYTEGSKRILEKQMFIGESPHPIYKGALKKFDGSNYVLTESWQNYLDIFVLSDIGGNLSRFIGYQWYNQFKRTRTIIESDIQGLTDNLPSQINRWIIKHGDQEEKYFMLTSIRGMNFFNCGWVGVFVETSTGAGDRAYSGATDSTFLNFKYLR
jgi:hypothetical protein